MIKRKVFLAVFICYGFFSLAGGELESLYNQAMSASKNGRNEQALDLLWQCLDFTKEDPVATVHILLDSADIMAEMGNKAEALKIYNKCLNFYHSQGLPEGLVKTLNNMAYLFKKSGEYTKAAEYYKSALSYSVEYGLENMQMRILGNIVPVYIALGKFESALKYGQEGLSIAESRNDQIEIGFIHNNLGDIYISLGNYESAISHLNLALAAFAHADNKEANKEIVPILHINLATAYSYMGMYNRSLEEYIQAMNIMKGNPKKYLSEILNCANGIATNMVFKGNYKRALPFYEEALSLSRQKGSKSLTAQILGNMGTCYGYLEEDDQAYKCYNESSELYKEINSLPGMAKAETHLGTYYHDREEYKTTVEHLEKAVKIYEKLRLSAEGSLKRDYLAKSVTAYRWLISSHTRMGDGAAAFAAAEMISARLLREQLDQDRAETLQDFSVNKEKLSFLGEDTLIVNFANVDFSGAICRVSASTGGFFAEEYSIQNVVDQLNRRMGHTIRSFLYYHGSMEEHEITDSLDLEELVEYYRLLITSPFRTAEEEENIDLLARVFYDMLLADLDLEGIEHLLIIPGGILALLPFEALKNEEGRYLIEEYEVSYIPSLNVLDSLNNRPYRSSRRRDLLAMGGAVYQREGFSESQIQSERLLAGLRSQTEVEMERGAKLIDTYDQLGLSQWDNLPGAMAEVRSIGAAVEYSDIYIGEKVNEGFLKMLSRRGELKKYRAIHFATHGLVVPQYPELSALVLSQMEEGLDEEDGYLRVAEVARLDLKADFVNLSACETGLGRIYEGEGVVGLTQAFFEAGANGVSVSLWQVSDESTMEFMNGIYRAVESEHERGYLQAMTEMKREFIHSERFSDPYYWAPFVYYGKYE